MSIRKIKKELNKLPPSVSKTTRGTINKRLRAMGYQPSYSGKQHKYFISIIPSVSQADLIEVKSLLDYYQLTYEFI